MQQFNQNWCIITWESCKNRINKAINFVSGLISKLKGIVDNVFKKGDDVNTKPDIDSPNNSVCTLRDLRCPAGSKCETVVNEYIPESVFHSNVLKVTQMPIIKSKRILKILCMSYLKIKHLVQMELKLEMEQWWIL